MSTGASDAAMRQKPAGASGLPAGQGRAARGIAIFAAGCFWGVQFYFDEVPGVVETEVGYIGGHKDDPTYWDVASRKTGHAEAVKITFDPAKVSYDTLLMQFFRMHDPTQLNRQGPDVGDEYRSAIFYLDEAQKKAAQKMIDEYNKYRTDAKVVTTVEKAGTFWPAEEEHQKFTQKTGIGMCHIPYAPVEATSG
ncbi:MAG TPA: peptide-methionine (S)-S-oxide reductase MsrA [Candidatus Binatia bacterium]|nr:peptide-methionine (S)-S-oxide reductase MsrA [Candidatus Binatia bacterium]